MSFVNNDIKINGYRQLLPNENVIGGDIITKASLTEINEDDDNESVDYFRNSDSDIINVVFNTFEPGPSLGRNWRINRRKFTIWRKKPMLEKRDWQNQPLPLP